MCQVCEVEKVDFRCKETNQRVSWVMLWQKQGFLLDVSANYPRLPMLTMISMESWPVQTSLEYKY